MHGKLTCVVNDIAGDNDRLLSEHGLSFWVEMDAGVVLFDTGKSEKVLSNNLSVLNLDPQRIRGVALSHAHRDHTGGLGFILKNHPGMDIYSHPDIFTQRYSLKNGEYVRIGIPDEIEESLKKASLHMSSHPAQILPGLWTTGEITDRTEREGGSANHFTHEEVAWLPDRYRDDISLVLDLGDHLALICGCCHAGLLNTLFHVKKVFSKPVKLVMGGTHLLAAEKAYLEYITEKLEEHFPSVQYYLNHCTGEVAVKFLAETFSSRASDFPAGASVILI